MKAVPGEFSINGFPLMEFGRKPIDKHLLGGFAIAWTADLTLVHVVEDHTYHLNGYAIFRNADVKWWRPVPPDDFLARAVRLNKLRPSEPDDVTIASMKEAVESAGRAFPLITFHPERTRKGICYVGKMLRTTQRGVSILSISPEAEWDGEDSYLLRDITLLEFGGAYEKLLTRMAKAGPPPPLDVRKKRRDRRFDAIEEVHARSKASDSGAIQRDVVAAVRAARKRPSRAKP